MKKLLLLSMLLVFAVSISYAGDATKKSNSLMKRLVMNQRLLTGHSSVNYSVVTHKMGAHVFVIKHTFLNNLRLNQRLLTGFLNSTLYGTLEEDEGETGYNGESQHFDINLDVDNDGMVHETDTLTIPSATWPSCLTLTNSQIHVMLTYYPNWPVDLDDTPYVENFPGWFGNTTLSYDYPAADLYSKTIDFDWGDGTGDAPEWARTVVIMYYVP